MRNGGLEEAQAGINLRYADDTTIMQHYVNCKLPGVQAGFRKGRGIRDQIANIHWIIEKAREFQKKYLLVLY